MTSSYTVLSLEIQNLHRRENEMHHFYSELLGKLSNKEVKKSIKFIRDQEAGHIKMVTDIMSILREELSKG
jgi:rubrerythrin